jgi:hypothetical protein
LWSARRQLGPLERFWTTHVLLPCGVHHFFLQQRKNHVSIRGTGALHMNNSTEIFAQAINKLHVVIDGISVFAISD